ncbi:hypothetical protein [Flavobacterium sp. 2]|uniref:hypothetical protein n=1 Tax=Flavobacterium sp. 2 TaxID=308053 RepID=UPI003CF6D5A2
MERNLKITIPEPCHENWDKMTPIENGRFCLSCSKTVVDFTSMLPEEIQHFFIQNQSNKICGRFRKSQLDSITIQIPNRILYSQTHYSKMFLLALFIAMGTTLFSCQDKDGNKKKIDTIEVVDTDKNQNDKLKQIPPPPPPPPREKNANQENSEKLNKMVSGEVITENQATNDRESKNKKATSYSSTAKNNKEEKTKPTKANSKKAIEEPVYNGGIAVETNAEFPGGIEQFYNFFEKEFKKPQSSETANLKINLSFAVERNGSVTYLQSIPEIDSSTEQEIKRVLSLCPKWQPGETNGKKARRLYSLPIVLK